MDGLRRNRKRSSRDYAAKATRTISQLVRNPVIVKPLTGNVGYYPPIGRTQPPDFGPNSVPAAVALLIDAHFAQDSERATDPSHEMPYRERLPYDVFPLYVTEHSHPMQSFLQSPIRIITNHLCIVPHPVLPRVVHFDEPGLRPIAFSVGGMKHREERLRDVQFLAQSSLRAHNIRDEATAYFNIALMCDQEEALTKAVGYYKRYLLVLGADADPIAFNRIAVDFFLLRQYDEAIEWNMQHLKYSRSLFETVAANCNIALICRLVGDWAKASDLYIAALGVARQMGEEAQPMFVDLLAKMRKALEEEVGLSQRERPPPIDGWFGDRCDGSVTPLEHRDFLRATADVALMQGDLCGAYQRQLDAGRLASLHGDFLDGESCYEEALKLAGRIGAWDLIDYARVALGLVRCCKSLTGYGMINCGSADKAPIDSTIFVWNPCVDWPPTEDGGVVWSLDGMSWFSRP